jgi:hypothetical protein
VRYVIDTSTRWQLPRLARWLFRTPYSLADFLLMTGGARRDNGPATRRLIVDFDAAGYRLEATMQKDPGPFPFGGIGSESHTSALHPDDRLLLDLDKVHPGMRVTAHRKDGSTVTGTVYLDPRAGGPDTLQVMVVIPRADIDSIEAP